MKIHLNSLSSILPKRFESLWGEFCVPHGMLNGAPRSGEPGIHNLSFPVWIPESLALLGFRNDRCYFFDSVLWAITAVPSATPNRP
jgi:hypothetical protein